MKKLLIIIVLAGMILAPIGAGVAFAQEGAVGYVAGKIIGAMGWHDVITSVFADLGNIVLTIVSKVLNISGAILNASVELSIGRVGELIEKVPIVSVGWTVFRDIANLFFLVTAFIFFAAAVLFIVRAVVLMFVMILAPLAFVAWVFPGMKSHTDKWWHALFSYTFFAPVYMALNYAVANAIQSGGMAELLKIQNNEASFAALMTSESSGNIGIVINYLILIVAIAASLIIAKK